MYTPSHFAESDPQQILSLLHRHSFATVVTHDGSAPFATHMAQANPQWRHFAAGCEVLVIFHGPHAYISPNWYEARPMVPTWNYATVHAYGIPRVIEDKAALRTMLRELVDTFEAGQPQPYGAALTDDYIDQLSPGIVGLEIPITRLEAKFKLSQNRTPADQAGIIAALAKSADQTERELAVMMKNQTLKAEPGS